MQGPCQALPQTSPGQAASGTCPRHMLSCRVDWEEARGQRSTRQSPRCRRQGRQANQGALSKCFKHKWDPSVCAHAEQLGSGTWNRAVAQGWRACSRRESEPQHPGPGRNSGARVEANHGTWEEEVGMGDARH